MSLAHPAPRGIALRSAPLLILAWATAGTVGVPAILLAALGLAGGDAFTLLPFSLTPLAVPFVLAPVGAMLLTGIAGQARHLALTAAVVLMGGAAAVTAVACPILALLVPLSMLDDSDQWRVTLPTVVGATVIDAAYAAMAILLCVTLVKSRRAARAERVTVRGLRQLGVIVVATIVLLATAAGAGALSANAVDRNGIPTGPVRASWMAGRPESDLVYPGAHINSHFVGGEQRALANTQEAQARTDFSTPASPDTVAAYYTSHLIASGWHPIPWILSVGPRAWGFKRGDRELFSLELLEPAQFPTPTGESRFWATYDVFPAGATHF